MLNWYLGVICTFLILTPKSFSQNYQLNNTIKFFDASLNRFGNSINNLNHEINNHAIEIIKNAKNPRVKNIIEKYIINPELPTNEYIACAFFIAAYATEDPELKNKALKLLKLSINRINLSYLKPSNTPQHENKNTLHSYIEQILQLANDYKLREENDFYATIITQMFLELALPYDDFKEIIEKNIISASNTNLINICEKFIITKKGLPYLENLKDKLLDKFIKEINSTIEEYKSSPTDNGIYFDDSQIFFIQNNIEKTKVSNFINEQLEFLTLSENWNIEKFYALAYSTNNESLKLKAVTVLQKRISGNDKNFNLFFDRYYKNSYHYDDSFIERYFNINHYHDEDFFTYTYTDEEFLKYENSRNLEVNSLQNRLIWFFEKNIQFVKRYNREGFNPEVIANLFAEMDFDYSVLKERVEFFIFLNPQNFENVVEVSKEYIRVVKGELYLNEKLRQHDNNNLNGAINFLKNLKNQDNQNQNHIKQNNNIYFIIKNFSNYRIQQLLEENIDYMISKNTQINRILLLISYSSPKEPLRNKILNHYRKIIYDDKYKTDDNEVNQSITERFTNLFYEFNEHNNRGLNHDQFDITKLLIDLNLDYEEVKEPIENHLDFHMAPEFQIKNLSNSYILKVKGVEYYNKLIEKKMYENQNSELINIFKQIEQIYQKAQTGRNLSREEAINLDRNITLLIQKSSEELAVQFLLRNLSDLTLMREHWHFRGLFLAAHMSNNIELREHATLILLKRINGEDETFNKTLGKNMLTKKDRFMFYFTEIYSESFDTFKTNVHSSRELFSEEAIKLISSLEIDYFHIKDFVERSSRHKTSIFKKASQDFIKEKKNELYLQLVSNPPFEGIKRFVYINGGYTPTTNYEANESDLMSFHNNLFHSETIILNAGGEGTKVVKIDQHGHIKRDDQGLIVLEPGYDIGKPVSAATKENVTELLNMLSLEPEVKEITIVWGDHGGPDGLALWGKTSLTANEISTFYKKFPQETLIRSIFIHCYAGASIVFNKRRVPGLIVSLDKFIQYYYPPNRCAMGTSSDNEVGEYYTWNSSFDHFDNNEWSKTFRKHHGLSLKKLKDHFNFDDSVKITPVLTSDYFVRDIKEALCKEHEKILEIKNKYGENFENIALSDSNTIHKSIVLKEKTLVWENILNELCIDSELAKEIEEFKIKYKNVDVLYSELRKLHKSMATEIVDENFYSIKENHSYARKKIDEIKANAILKNTSLTMKDIKEINVLQSTYIDEYDKLVKSIKRISDFRETINNKTKIFIEKKHPVYKEYLNNSFINDTFDGWIIEQLMSNVVRDMHNFQIQLRKKNKIHSRHLKNWVEVLLNEQIFDEVRKIYESIQNCENSIIN